MKAVDWFFRNRQTGDITVAQFPNPSLCLFLAAVAVRAAWRPVGGARTGLDALATVAALWWATDEIVRGVNPWRRCLGAAVLALTVAHLVG